jgi:hypothetical protein
MIDTDLIAIASRPARGRRPQFCEDPLTEQLFGISLALATELAVTRQRLATLERALVARGVLGDDIERHQADEAQSTADSAALEELMARVFRPLLQDPRP